MVEFDPPIEAMGIYDEEGRKKVFPTSISTETAFEILDKYHYHDSSDIVIEYQEDEPSDPEPLTFDIDGPNGEALQITFTDIFIPTKDYERLIRSEFIELL